ncbi:MAG: hypothetical protein OXR66_00470 [Candidatus Woesearchaeota archaeon]|nr:hypothetical protein [Candidatus Woesearchaeota archaeon]
MFSDIYALGRTFPFGWESERMQQKLTFVLFPYASRAVVSTTLFVLALGCVFAAIGYVFFPFLGYTLLFLTLTGCVGLYIYPSHIFYTQAIGEYNEEMLRAILRMVTYISMDTSIEYAVVETADHLHGTLKLQFEQIKHDLERKQQVTLGKALEQYLDIWNSVNPVFVKSFRLLQTAALSEKKDRAAILDETVETMLLNYSTLGKRYAEELSGNAKKLITIGVLIPIMSLMLVPLLSIFMPNFAKPSILAFIYIIFFPTVTLIMALNFAAKRVQIDTIRIEEAAEYTPLPPWLAWTGIGIAFVFAVPTFFFLTTVQAGEPSAESFFAIFMGWLVGAGCVVGLYLYAFVYGRKYASLWSKVNEIEQDLPHLLQSFTTYLTLNIATENVIPEVVNDYKKFGFEKHPIVGAFSKLQRLILTSKRTLKDIVRHQLPKLLPSRKVNQVLIQIVSFSEISQKSSAKIAKMVRSQTMNLYKLDDYIKTMLAETIGLINITITLLAPLLAAAAVIMSVAIVKSLVFISEQLSLIANSFGTTAIGFTLVDTTKIIPPVFIEAIIGIYLVETVLVLSFFSTQINVGNDKFKFFETLRSNLVGFAIYTVLLFGGYLFVVEVLFKSILLS